MLTPLSLLQVCPWRALLRLPARSLFADQNKNPRRQRNKIEEQNGRAEINAKTHEPVNNEENRG